MWCPLAFLLALDLRFRDACYSSSSLWASQETRLGEDVGEVAVKSSTTAWGKDGVGMVDVSPGEILDG